ncbi:hypothetical protein HY837_02190 [archaeon]|nr:hypothetical protein [archaeon]
MKSEIKQLRDKFERSKKEFDSTKEDLERVVNSCKHQFGKTIPDHIHYPAYTIPGDPPGTMGVDRRGPCYVDAKTEKRWKRICDVCGKVEYTSTVKQKIEELPEWPEERRYS